MVNRILGPQRGPHRRAGEERETGEQAEGAVVARGTRVFLLSRLA
jgi:hypothetical protein